MSGTRIQTFCPTTSRCLSKNQYWKPKIINFVIIRNSIETQDIEDEEKDELSGASYLGSGISYNLDDYDIDSDSDEKLIIDTPIDEV